MTTTTRSAAGMHGDDGVPRRGEQWYRLVHDSYATMLLSYFLRRVDHHHAHDLVADVFLIAWRRRDDAPDEADLRAWLFRVARNVLRNHQRTTARWRRLRRRLQDTATRAHDANPTDHIDQGARLRSALATLREADREVLKLAAWEQCTTAEIAVILNCSANAAAVRLHRARARLRTALASDGITSAAPPSSGAPTDRSGGATDVQRR